jgi:invasion protein IalB
MPDMTRTTVAAALAALLATSAIAQEEAQTPAEPTGEAAPAETQGAGAAEEAPAEETGGLGLSMGDEQSQVGRTYTREEHGDWEVRCVHTETGNDPCQLYQLLQDQDGNNVAEISIFPLPPGGEAIAGATIITPLETLLTAQISLRVDSGAAKRYPFSWCSSMGCFSRIGFTADEVLSFRRGASATLTIRPVAAPDQTVDLSISLAGFTAGYEAVAEANADALQQQQQQ